MITVKQVRIHVGNLDVPDVPCLILLGVKADQVGHFPSLKIRFSEETQVNRRSMLAEHRKICRILQNKLTNIAEKNC